MRRRSYIVYAFLAFLLLMACANLGSPDGGAYDETPPKIVHTSPKFGASNVKATKIVLEFDENIKLDNPNEKVVISPPQINQPEIEGQGKRITVTLMDSLIMGATYTIDFADAIEDNNEGNPMGDYAFTFSTGERLDTFQVSGHVLDAENLEPIKGILVGLYAVGDSLYSDSLESVEVTSTDVLPDSVFRTRPFERVSRTDSRGHFIIKGLAKRKYRVFALKDQDQNYLFSQKSEQLAFSPRVVFPYSRPDIRPDTVWHDSIFYDSIVYTPFTHFYPEDIVLLAFKEAGQNRSFIKVERPQLEKFSLFFTAGDDTVPHIEGVNFRPDSAFVLDKSQNNDTIHYWIRDSLIYNLDTLKMVVTYNVHDSLGVLVPFSDSLEVVSKLSYEKVQKRKKDEWEEYAKQYRKEYKRGLKEKKMDDEPLELELGDDLTEDEPVADDEVVDDEGLSDTLSLADSLLADTLQLDSLPRVEEVSDTLLNDADLEEEPEPQEAVQEGTKSKKSLKTANTIEKNKSKKKKSKSSGIKDEDIPVPPMPEKFLDMKTGKSTMNPDDNFEMTFTTPIDTAYAEMFHFREHVDTVMQERPFILRRIPGKVNAYRFYAEWHPDSKYELAVDTGAIVDIYGKRVAGSKKSINIKPLKDYCTLFVRLQNSHPSAVVQLMNSSDKPVKTIKAKDGKADFYFIDAGTYYLRVFYDHNGDGVWTTGDYDAQQQPEETYYYPGGLELKAGWDIKQDWDPSARPVAGQKPEKITKQKPDKEKAVKSRNAERERNKKNGTANSNNNQRYDTSL